MKETQHHAISCNQHTSKLELSSCVKGTKQMVDVICVFIQNQCHTTMIQFESSEQSINILVFQIDMSVVHLNQWLTLALVNGRALSIIHLLSQNHLKCSLVSINCSLSTLQTEFLGIIGETEAGYECHRQEKGAFIGPVVAKRFHE